MAPAHGSRSRSRSPKRQRRDRAGSGSPRARSRSPAKRRFSRSPSRSRSPPGFAGGRGGLNGYSPTRCMAFGARFGAGGLAGASRVGPGGAGAAGGGGPGVGTSPPPWVSNARLAPQVKMVLEGLYGRGKLGPGDLEYACIEFLELLGPVGGMAVLEEFASLDFFRIRNLTAFFIGICKRVQARAPPPPGRPLRGPDGNSPPPAGGGSRGRSLARGAVGGISRSPGAAPAMRRASPPLHFMMEDNSPPLRRWVSKSPPPRRWVSKSPPQRRFNNGSKSPPPRRWVSRSPPPRRFESKSPPPRRWVSKSPPLRRVGSRSPPPRRWVSRSPPSRRAQSKSPQRRGRAPGSRSQSRSMSKSRSRSRKRSKSRSRSRSKSRSRSRSRSRSKSRSRSRSKSKSRSKSRSRSAPPAEEQQRPRGRSASPPSERAAEATQGEQPAQQAGSSRAALLNISTSSRTSASGADKGAADGSGGASTAALRGRLVDTAGNAPPLAAPSPGPDWEGAATGEGGFGRATEQPPQATASATCGQSDAGGHVQEALPSSNSQRGAVDHGGQPAPPPPAQQASKGPLNESLPLGEACVSAPAADVPPKDLPQTGASAPKTLRSPEANDKPSSCTAPAAAVVAPALSGTAGAVATVPTHIADPLAGDSLAAEGAASAASLAVAGGFITPGDLHQADDVAALLEPSALLDIRLASAAMAALQSASACGAGGGANGFSSAASALAGAVACGVDHIFPLSACPLGGWMTLDLGSRGGSTGARISPSGGASAAWASPGKGASEQALAVPDNVGPSLDSAAAAVAGSDALGDAAATQPRPFSAPAAAPGVIMLGSLLSQALAAAAGGASGGCEGGILRQAVTEHVKERLKPAWRANKLTRETFKAVAKTAVDRVLATLPNNGASSLYDSPAAVALYFSEARRECISRLVEAILQRLVGGTTVGSVAVADGSGQAPLVCSPSVLHV